MGDGLMLRGLFGLLVMMERRMVNEESTTPFITLFAASTPWPTLPRISSSRAIVASGVGGVNIDGLRGTGRGVKSAVLFDVMNIEPIDL